MGIKTEVDDWELKTTGPHKIGRLVIDPQGCKAWLDEEVVDWGWKRDPKWKLGVSTT